MLIRDQLQQEKICKRFNADFLEAPPDLILGVSRSAKELITPLNGLRHPPDSGSTGWFIWGGEDYSEDPDFFEPLCVKHLHNWCPNIIPYLGLAPGWRFLVAKDYEDVWFDKTLLVLNDE